MTELLKNSLSYNHQHHLYIPYCNQYRKCYQYIGCCTNFSSGIKANRWHAAGTYAPFGVFPPRTTRADLKLRSIRFDNSKIVLHKPASLVCRSIGEEGNRVVKKGLEIGANSLERKLPSWDYQEIEEDLDFGSASEHSSISEGSVSVDENRVYYLEERNEEGLSKRILELSRTNKIRSALELFRSMELSGLLPNVHASNSLLSCLLRNEMLDDALKIFEFMKAHEIGSGHTYSLVLKGIAEAWGCNAAVNIFEELEGKYSIKKYFDAVVYNTMISVCGKVNNWVQADRIWRKMKEHNLIGTTVTYRMLVCTFARCGQNELALDAYHEMVQNGLSPGDDEMQAIIGACAKEGNWELGLRVFQNMVNSGLKLNPVVCNALINSLGKDGQVKLAFKVYNLMKSLGHTPDSYTWNALLGALYRANRHGDVLRFFESIREEQSSLLNVHLYNTSLMSCQRLGLWDKALQLIWQMEASRVPVSTASYNLVIGSCEVARKPEIALQVYEHMVHRKCTPDTFTLLSLIRCCIWGSLWEEVEGILNIAPDVSLYNAAIQGMCLRGKFDSARKLYTMMRRSDLEPDGKTRALMLQSLPKKSYKRRKRCS